MPVASFNKYNQASEVLVEAINAGADSWKVVLSNTAPDVTDTNLVSASEIAAGNGYTAGGNTAAVVSSSQTGGVYKLVLSSPADWTATGAGFTARYAILYNFTLDAVFGWWDYGSSQVVAAGEVFGVTLDGTNGVFTVT